MSMYEYDNSFLFITLKAARSFFKTGTGKISNLEVMLSSPDLVQAIRSQILIKAGVPVNILDWQKTNASFFNAIQVEAPLHRHVLTVHSRLLT